LSVEIGGGAHTYRAHEGQWGELPEGWEFRDVGGVAVDANDDVYVFNRGTHPVVVLDREGRVLRWWGDGIFTRPHGIDIGPDGSIWCTDDGDHTVRKCTPDGEVLLEIGVPGKAAPFMSGEPFSRCTHTALSPTGEIYVTDGYSNARVHKFSAEGEPLLSWGSPGIGEGEFNLPHNIACDADGRVYVADRENHRIQVFDGDGRFETQWHGVHRPSALHLTAGPDPVFLVGECGPVLEFQLGAPNLGPRLSVLTTTGELVTRLGAEPTRGIDAGRFISPHGLATDSRGDIYVGEVSHTGWPNVYGHDRRPHPLRALQKLVKVDGEQV
jgi:hypothetical protein